MIAAIYARKSTDQSGIVAGQPFDAFHQSERSM